MAMQMDSNCLPVPEKRQHAAAVVSTVSVTGLGAATAVMKFMMLRGTLKVMIHLAQQ